MSTILPILTAVLLTGDLTLAVDSPYLDWVPPCPVTALKGKNFYNLGHIP